MSCNVMMGHVLSVTWTLLWVSNVILSKPVVRAYVYLRPRMGSGG